jgi:hypothetical protein
MQIMIGTTYTDSDWIDTKESISLTAHIASEAALLCRLVLPFPSKGAFPDISFSFKTKSFQPSRHGRRPARAKTLLCPW